MVYHVRYHRSLDVCAYREALQQVLPASQRRLGWLQQENDFCLHSFVGSARVEKQQKQRKQQGEVYLLVSSFFIGQFFFTFSNKKEWEKKNARAIILLQPTRFWVINLHSQRFAEINFVVDMRGHFFSVRRLLVYLLSFLGLEAKCVKRNFYNFTKNRLPLALVLVPGLGYKSPCK